MDAIDRAIIRALERDGRLSHEALARELNSSRQTIADRLGRLVAEGSVEIRGVAHPRLIGVESIAHVVFEVDGPVSKLAELLAQDSRFAFVSIVAGPWPLVAEIRAASDESLAQAVAMARSQPQVRTLVTTRYLSLVRDVIGPVGTLSTAVDDVDRRIITELELDGRASYIDIARRTGRSPSSVRQRVLRLIEGRAVRVGAVVRRGAADAIASLGVGVRLDADDEDVVERLRAQEAVFFAARSLGHYDLILSLRATGASDALGKVESIRSWAGVRSADAWLHFHVVKEDYALPVLPA